MDLQIKRIKQLSSDYIGVLLLALVIIILSYFTYFLYQNIYLTVAEKVPLEEVVVKEKINLDFYQQVRDAVKEKQTNKINTSSWRDLFKG